MNTLVIIEALLCFISTIASAAVAALLIIYRRSKIHYRLCIGLCISYMVVNLLCGIGLVSDSFLDYDVLDDLHITAMTISVLYMTFIFIHYLLRVKGYNEEELHNKDIFVHPLIWIFGGAYFIGYYTSHFTVKYISVGFLLLSIVFCFAITFYIVHKQSQEYKKKGEVLSPLVSSRNKNVMIGFQIRLVVLMVLDLCVSANMALIIFMNFIMDRENVNPRWIEVILMSCSITGFISVVVVASAPELKRYIKHRQSIRAAQIHLMN